MIENRLLRYFVMTAQCENITKAASNLGIAQPSLTRQIHLLEEQLGQKLFTRGKRKTSLTKEGEFLLGRAKEILSLVEKTENSFKGNENVIVGDISIGSGETATMGFIADICREIQLEHPNIRFHLYSGNADAIYERLDQGLIDIGLTLGSNQLDRFDYLPLKRFDYFGVLIRKDHQLAKKTTLRLEDLKAEKLIVSAQSSHGFEQDAALDKIKEEFHVIATYNLIHNATFLVENQMGIALCIDHIVNTDSQSSLKFIPLIPQIKIASYLAIKKFQPLSPAAKCFMAKVKEKVG